MSEARRISHMLDCDDQSRVQADTGAQARNACLTNLYALAHKIECVASQGVSGNTDPSALQHLVRQLKHEAKALPVAQLAGAAEAS